MSTLAARKDALIVGLVGAMIGVFVGAALVAATPADAANGSYVVMGTKNNARNSTKIISPNSTQFINTKAGRPAITLNVKPGAPPMVVNSDYLIDNLHADYLDGFDAADLITSYTWESNDGIPGNQDWSSTTKTFIVPLGGGGLLMSGTVGMWNNAAAADWVECAFYVDGSELSASRQRVYIQAGEMGICTSTAATTVGSGLATVQFLTAGMAPVTLAPDNGTWWAIMTPGAAE